MARPRDPFDPAPYDELRWANKPDRVRYLLIGESPPDPGGGPLRFFYAPQFHGHDHLYLAVTAALFGEVPDPLNKPPILARLKAENWWLLDAVGYPINSIKDDRVRREIIRSEFSKLRMSLLRPEVRPEVGCIICMPRVFSELAARIRELGIAVLHDESIPFPIGSSCTPFVQALRAAAGLDGPRPANTQ